MKKIYSTRFPDPDDRVRRYCHEVSAHQYSMCKVLPTVFSHFLAVRNALDQEGASEALLG